MLSAIVRLIWLESLIGNTSRSHAQDAVHAILSISGLPTKVQVLPREIQMPTQTGSIRRRSPHIGNYTGALVDYNGVGIWSAEAIQKRYRTYADALRATPSRLEPRRHTENGRTWVYPFMEQIINLIEAGDEAAIEIGIEFIQEDDYFVFGAILKSNTARALRRASLTPQQQTRIRDRLVGMMVSGQVPREWREYKRLLRHVGLSSLWPALENGIDRENKYVMRYYNYLDRYARTS